MHLLPTEPIGSVPRPAYLLEAMSAFQNQQISQSEFDSVVDRALKETITAFEKSGSQIITDGEQSKPSFATYPLTPASG